MRRRKDFASLLRNMERPIERNTHMGIESSISNDGMTINGQNLSDSEIRDLHVALPYGISSSGIDGVRVQIITNDNKNNVAVGVIDKDRPKVKSGCIIIYDKSGSTISLNGDGNIRINSDGDIRINSNKNKDVYINNTSFKGILNRIKELEDDIKELSNRITALDNRVTALSNKS